MAKHCTKCTRYLHAARFSRNSSKKDGLQSWCKACKAEKHQENKGHNITLTQQRKRKLAIWVCDYKSTRPCKRCGESCVACLQFHHIDPALKEITLNRAIANGWSITRMQTEINKCEILCANCHFKEHYTP